MHDKFRSPIKHHLALHRIDPSGQRRFYSLMIEKDLFEIVRLVCCWGTVGTRGQEMATEFATETDAAEALEAMASAKRQRGYQDL